jgi:oligopeptide/dipeptide ABC transporter ATP-binding protein
VNQPVLDIQGLSVNYQTGQGPLQALRDVSLTVPPGKIIGIVGESGCGKSTLISAIIRLLTPNARISNGAIRFKGNDLLKLSPEKMRSLRGDEISMVFQDPMTSLNPVLTIGRQMADVQHRSAASHTGKNARSLMMLERVGIPDPQTQLQRYPHHLSGGMRQRVAIAMALMVEPSLLIADEPTTALDATLEVQIIRRLRELQRDFGCAILFISHHLGVITELCDEVVVMYAGEVVENGPMRDVFGAPSHPYTQNLLECDPARIAQRTRNLPVIKGSLPNLVNLPDGCIFAERCSQCFARCEVERPHLSRATSADGTHGAACHLLESAS